MKQSEWVPTQIQIDTFLDALPASSIPEMSTRLGLGYSIATLKSIKTYINHHPELGYGTVSAVKPGSPDYANEPRHRLIVPEDDVRPLSGMASVIHNAGMYTELIANEIKTRIEAYPEEATILMPLIKTLDYSTFVIREAESKLA